jgi:hypothetical protein
MTTRAYIKKLKMSQQMIRRDVGHKTTLYVNFYNNIEIGDDTLTAYLVDDLRHLADELMRKLTEAAVAE